MHEFKTRCRYILRVGLCATLVVELGQYLLLFPQWFMLLSTACLVSYTFPVAYVLRYALSC